jgi:O-acetylserine/cysteine efflux transporter
MKPIDLLLVLLMCLLWSSGYIAIKLALKVINPIFFNSLRFGLVALCALPFCRRIPRKHIFLLFQMSIILVMFAYVFAGIGISMNSSLAVANIISKLNVIMSVIFGAIFLGEKVSKSAILGIVIAFLGTALVVAGNSLIFSTSGLITLDKKNLISFAALSVSVLAWPIYAILSKKISKDLLWYEIMGWTAFFGSIIAFITSMFFEANQLNIISEMDLQLFSLIFISAIGAVLIPYKIFYHLIQKYEIGKIMTASLTVPIFCAIQSYLVFGDKPGLTVIFGGTLILFGIYLTIKSPNLKNE